MGTFLRVVADYELSVTATIVVQKERVFVTGEITISEEYLRQNCLYYESALLKSEFRSAAFSGLGCGGEHCAYDGDVSVVAGGVG